MDDKIRRRIQLNCLYEMFRDRIEENVIYIVYSENDAKIDTTIDQLMSISSCSFTGHYFENKLKQQQQQQSAQRLLVPTSATHNAANSPSNQSTNIFRTQKQSNNGNVKKNIDLERASNSQTEDEDDRSKMSIDEEIEKLQKSIDDLLMEKNTSHDKASQYLSKKMYPVTSYYSEFASQLRSMIEKKTTQLVDLLLVKSQNSNSIDLHGLNPIQARLIVSELLKVREEKLLIDKQGEASIDIITGWGKHSLPQGQHRVRPTIVSLLREKGLEYQYLNKGALRVTIRRC